MTAEEALHICKLATKCAVFDQQCTDMTEFVDAMKQKYDLEVMVDCIQKQIPKKPIIRKTKDYFGCVKYILCPNCEIVEFGHEHPCFCKLCGQAIDWEE